MIIQHNIMALNSYNKLATNNSAVQKNLEKLSSGYRINRAGDDAAGLAISEKMRAQITGLERAKLNAQDGISLVQTAEGALTEVHSMLNRLVELGTESANGIYQAEDREKIQAEVNQIGEEIDRISKATNFNGIKLLDGSLALEANDSVKLETGGVDFSDGMEITNEAGKGAQSEFNIEINGTFGEGDTLTINYTLPNAGGGGETKSLTLTYTDGAPTANKLEFTGNTKEEQIDSIKNLLLDGTNTALPADFKMKDNTGAATTESVFEEGKTEPTDGKYTISTDGGKLTIKANNEGASGKLHISSIVTSNADTTISTSTVQAGVNGTGGATDAKGQQVIENFATGLANIQAGDKLQFEFNLWDGKTATVELEVTDEMINKNHDVMTTNIVNALQESNFVDDDTTDGMDESQFKVKDFFTLSPNVGEIGTPAIGSFNVDLTAAAKLNIKTATKGGDYRITDINRIARGETAATSIVDNANGPTKITDQAATGTTMTAAKKETKDATFTNNFTVGDDFILKGKLADGRNFQVTLSAGTAADLEKNVFAKGATLDASLTNIKNALEDANIKVDIVDARGNVTGQLTGADVFATSGEGANMTVTATTGKLTFTNAKEGAGLLGVNGSITSADVVPGGAAAASGKQTVAGVDQDSALTSIDFSDISKLEYGTTITIGSKQFEFVAGADSELSEAGNIRVILDNLENATGEEVANNLKDAINAQLTDKDGKITDYAAELGLASKDDIGKLAVSTDPVNPGDPARNLNLATVDTGSSKVELKSIAKGGDVAKVDAKDTYGNKENTTLSFAKNDDGSLKLKAGDTVIINGKTYQFDTDVRNAKGTNNVIKVDDFTDEAKIAEAVKTALNIDDPTVEVKINDDNSVTFSGAGKNTAPTVEIGADKGGLTLQIGDTADVFNKVTVSVSDMSTKGLGIDNLQVTDQGLASESIDKVKGAIERVSVTRGNLGALQNRLEHTINNLATTTENMTAAESRIRDTDMAKEMMNFTKNNVLVQAAQAMLAQANQQPQQVLQLLR